MLPDLDRLIRLQHLETAASEARRRIAEYPARAEALDARLRAAREAVAEVKAKQAAAQERRRADEKDVAVVQGRLAKYKDQLLEVKTNREYQAMLHEIEAAQTDIRAREDRILEIMMEGDELAAAIKRSEADLSAAEKTVADERGVLERDLAALQRELAETAAAREQLVSSIDPRALGTFEQVARSRKGLAVAEARNGLCTICHVRLRPQVFNEIRRNASLIQCDSCQRILYFVGETEAPSIVPQS